jgi:hypothetical protein
LTQDLLIESGSQDYFRDDAFCLQPALQAAPQGLASPEALRGLSLWLSAGS